MGNDFSEGAVNFGNMQQIEWRFCVNTIRMTPDVGRLRKPGRGNLSKVGPRWPATRAGASFGRGEVDRVDSLFGMRMPTFRSIGRGSVIALACGLLTAGVALADLAEGPRVANWTLGTPDVVSSGERVALPEGTFISDYVVEAAATGDDPDLLPEGILRLTLSAFSPRVDMNDQDKGQWYVTGKWELVDNDSDPSADVRTVPGTLKGLVNLELPYNPLTAPAARSWTSPVKVPLTAFLPAGEAGLGQNVRGEGSVELGPDTGSALSLQLVFYPPVE